MVFKTNLCLFLKTPPKSMFQPLLLLLVILRTPATATATIITICYGYFSCADDAAASNDGDNSCDDCRDDDN